MTQNSPWTERFELGEPLGEGGMGVVHRAWDRAIGKEVALKRMRQVGALEVQRIKVEFRARSALQHRNLVQLFDLIVDGDDCFFTMELVEGTDFASWVRRGDAPLLDDEWSREGRTSELAPRGAPRPGARDPRSSRARPRARRPRSPSDRGAGARPRRRRPRAKSGARPRSIRRPSRVCARRRRSSAWGSRSFTTRRSSTVTSSRRTSA